MVWKRHPPSPQLLFGVVCSVLWHVVGLRINSSQASSGPDDRGSHRVAGMAPDLVCMDAAGEDVQLRVGGTVFTEFALRIWIIRLEWEALQRSGIGDNEWHRQLQHFKHRMKGAARYESL